jgi:redox-sensitive bicupin YhaK (pirin superfamily)
MPAISVDDPLTLPRLSAPSPQARPRPVAGVEPARRTVEGAGFVVWRPFPGSLDVRLTDPFFLLDQLGPVHYGPHEPVGAPWHPHRGFETVTYVLDGSIAHHDSNGGGGVIGAGDTQWMTAGAGILHDEVPTEAFVRSGGLSHGVQLWVNLPAADKFTPPAYQAICAGDLTLLTSHDGGALIRLIAGGLGEHRGPGSTHTPITYAHISLRPGARLEMNWDPGFSAMVYVLSGVGDAGFERRPMTDHDLVLFGTGDTIAVQASTQQVNPDDDLELLVLGGQPLREPIAHWGPFLMNTRQQIAEAIADYQAGRMGTIPAITR